MQASHDPQSARKLDEVKARMAAGYYFAPGVALRTAEMILKNHPSMFVGPQKPGPRPGCTLPPPPSKI